MPVIVACRSCGRKLRVSDDLLGRKVQCPSCGETFDAESAEHEPPPERNDTPPTEGPLPTLEVDHQPRCLRCDEPVERTDVRCRYCGSDPADDDDRPWEQPQRRPVRRDCEPERGGVILTMGIVSLLLPVLGLVLGLAAWIMGAKDLGKMRKGQMDPQGEGTTQAGLICGIIGMAMQLLLTLTCVAPFVFGLLAAAAVTRMPAPPAPVLKGTTAPAPVPPAAPEDE